MNERDQANVNTEPNLGKVLLEILKTIVRNLPVDIKYSMDRQVNFIGSLVVTKLLNVINPVKRH